MPPKKKPERVLRIETTWIREYARTYFPTESGFSFCAGDLRASGISLVTIRHVLSRGYVTRSDKLNGPGAIWTVEGQDIDGDWHEISIKVISEEWDVTLVYAERQDTVQRLPATIKVKRAARE
jgi:hypothetical protein